MYTALMANRLLSLACFNWKELLTLVMLGVPNSLFCQKKIGFLVKRLL